MQVISLRSLAIAAVLGLGSTLNVAQAGMFDMINPSRWFDNDRDDYYGYGGPYGHGPYGPYGYGPYGYGGPYGGWGGYPGYGYPGYGYPGYGPSTIVVNPGAQQGQQQQQQRLPE